jgi:hypothetical protein
VQPCGLGTGVLATIGVNLRFDELRIGKEWESGRLLAAWLNLTAAPHGNRTALHGALPLQNPCKTKGENRSHPLHHLRGFDEAVPGIGPTLDEGDPLGEQHAEQQAQRSRSEDARGSHGARYRP